MGFRATLRSLAPRRSIHVFTDTDGLDASLLAATADALDRDPAIDAVYSVGGGERRHLGRLRPGRADVRVYLAHDLDEDNVEPLRQGRRIAVPHHDLRLDLPDPAPGARRVTRSSVVAVVADSGHHARQATGASDLARRMSVVVPELRPQVGPAARRAAE